MVGQRIFGIALGYEDVVNHDELRHDPIMAMLAGKLVAHAARTARRWPAKRRSTGSNWLPTSRRPITRSATTAGD